ncbi:MAG: winged helix-turn-helix transcriptional regulator [candidate division WOR-3 bacterium]|nr:MAG: winged helix-turn-helix transcriptional regulator [candidate division WOR-3 bacterium]
MNREVHDKPMKEILYRESRVAKALGDPAKYTIIDLLLRHGPINVIEIAKNVHRSKSTVSHHLSKLKSLELVRYEAKIDGVYYWIKYPKELRAIVKSLKMFIKRTQRGLTHET